MLPLDAHPQWCAPLDCSATATGGAHKSRPLTVDLESTIINSQYHGDRGETLLGEILTLQLTKGSAGRAPFMTMAVTGATLFVPITAAWQLAGATWDLCDLVHAEDTR